MGVSKFSGDIYDGDRTVDSIDEIPDQERQLEGPSQADHVLSARVAHLTSALLSRNILDRSSGAAFGRHPSLRFLERFRRLLILEALTDELVRSILPSLRNRISFVSTNTLERHALRLTGAFDAKETLLSRPEALLSPLFTQYVSRRVERSFQTDENRLIVVTLLDVIADVESLLSHTDLYCHLAPKEKTALEDCAWRLRRELRQAPFNRLGEECQAIRRAESPFRRDHVETTAIRRIQLNGLMNAEAYQAFLRWREKYERLHLVDIGKETDIAPRDITREQEYELLTLLEILLRLSYQGRVTQIRAVGHSVGSPLFDCVFTDGTRWELYYQTAEPIRRYRRIKPLVGIPDLIIRNPKTDRVFLVDAKRYTVTSIGGALYKMMGYLYQFGYPDQFDRMAGACLFHPFPIAEEPPCSVWAGSPDSQNQLIASVCLPITGLATPHLKTACDRWIHTMRQRLDTLL